MNEASDMYSKRLLEYADKQEMFNIKEYECFPRGVTADSEYVSVAERVNKHSRLL